MVGIKSNNYKTNSMIILGLIFIIMGSALIAVLIMSEQTDGLTILGSVSSVFLIIVGAGCIYDCKHPSAIDVYRDKTTLQITYKDNIPTDTIVVYK